MRPPRRQLLEMLVGACTFAALPRATEAGTYPDRPVRVIVPFAPGGPADVLARVVSQKLMQSLGQPFYVENHTGAGGNLGMSNGAHAAPDGHTITVVGTSFVVNPASIPISHMILMRILRQLRSRPYRRTCWWCIRRSPPTPSKNLSRF
jgi:tripartite-type tricarboxylate transporter receptor subunit TctC